MVRFWPTLGIVCLLALVLYGLISALNGRIMDIQGQWLGPMPLEGGEDCRLQIFPTGSFDLECRGQTTYAAKGTWRQWEDNLEMRFSFFTKDQKHLKETPAPWLLSVRAARNEINVGGPNDRGQPYKWKRARL